MIPGNVASKPQGLARRHDSQFAETRPSSASTSPHHFDPSAHGRRVPAQPPTYSNNHGPLPHRNAAYPPQQAMRHPTPVIVELPDEDPALSLPSSTKFNPNAFNNSRNVPAGHAPLPQRNGQNFKPNRNQCLNQQGPYQHQQQGPGGHPGQGRSQTQDGITSEQHLREAYAQKMANTDRSNGRHAQDTSSRPPTQNPANGNGAGNPSSHHQAARGPPRPAHSQPSGRPQPHSALKTNGRPQQVKRKLDENESTASIPSAKPDADVGVTDFGIDGPTVTSVSEKVTTNTQVAVRPKLGPPAPKFLFNSTIDVSSPSKVACSIDLMAVWNTSKSQFLTRFKEQEAGTEKEIQWALISEVFGKQQEGLENTMEKYNDFINRYNDLSDIKNKNLQEKEDLTDRYRRAGATLSTQAGEMIRGRKEKDEGWRCSCRECMNPGTEPVEEEEEEEEEIEPVEEEEIAQEDRIMPEVEYGEREEVENDREEEDDVQVIDLSL